MGKLITRVVLGIAAGIAVYVGFSIWANAGRVADALARFHWGAAAAACALALGNYAVRFVRWQYYLRVLGLGTRRAKAAPPPEPIAGGSEPFEGSELGISVADSGMVFLAGFALTVTPGKLGEAVKAFLLRESHRIPIARTAPIVIAERVTDLVALLLLAMVGVFSFDVDRRFLVAGAVLVALAIAVISIEPMSELALSIAGRLPFVHRFAPRLREFHVHTAAMLRPAPLAVATALSCVSWFLECLAFWTVVGGMEGAAVSLRAATFIYSSMTVAGALSFLPGGLGVTEAGMLALLIRLGTGLDRGSAAAATFVTRACTLWFAVALGLPALIAYARRKHVHVEDVSH